MAILLVATSLCGQVWADGNFDRPTVKPLRVLILSGQGDHGWRFTAPFLRRILTDTGRFEARVCEAPAGVTARTLANFDVVVDDSGQSGPESDSEEVISSFVESGKGLVVTHGAVGTYAGDDPSRREQGHDRPESKRSASRSWPLLPSRATDLPVHFLEVRLSPHEHPIVQGLPSRFRVADAPYVGLRNAPETEVIATTRLEEKNGDGPRQAPILVAARWGKGRVFCTLLGHDLTAMQAGEFIATFVRGTEWAATGKVTLPADVALPRPRADAVRGLVITGGHDHETSFYSLFDGYRDLARMPVASSTSAFASDLRGKYDVLVMYDFSRDLDETGKKNLRDFVESGKGVVVLHHALLDYQQWSWWYQEVVGGSYRLKSAGTVPSSTVKDNQQLFVTPQRDNPITAGLTPFRIVDETYKRMWISPRVRPLLTTDNPNSDRILGWIGPCASSRVVAIQLGHGNSAFQHPSYRELVHNAILWSAGRIR
jgi:type 1 glutamine amidotransferase